MAGIKELQQKLESDKAFAESLQKASDIKELFQKIKDAGFDVKPEELAEAISGKESELADEELDAAAGGFKGNVGGSDFLTNLMMNLAKNPPRDVESMKKFSELLNRELGN
jgi:predicted ribosomally synthesized peptide with nif11-like leader